MQALYYDGKTSRPHPVRLAPEGLDLLISGEDILIRLPLDRIEVPARLASIPRILKLPDGGQLHCDDNEAVDALFRGRRPLESLVYRLEQYWPAALAAVVVVMLTVFLFFSRAVPWIGDQAAQRLPMEAEYVLAAQIEPILKRLGIEESALPSDTRARLEQQFNQIVADLPHAERYSLRFASWGDIPNALALPGGTVIVTDALVELLDDDRMVVAVMAHEVGHLEHRHVTRSMAQSASVFIILSLALGDISAMSVLGAGLPAFLVNNHFSREFEREADQYAFELLVAHDRSPLDFAGAMEKLTGDEMLEDSLPAFHYLSTHPPTRERIKAARQAAGHD